MLSRIYSIFLSFGLILKKADIHFKKTSFVLDTFLQHTVY